MWEAKGKKKSVAFKARPRCDSADNESRLCCGLESISKAGLTQGYTAKKPACVCFVRRADPVFNAVQTRGESAKEDARFLLETVIKRVGI